MFLFVNVQIQLIKPLSFIRFHKTGIAKQVQLVSIICLTTIGYKAKHAACNREQQGHSIGQCSRERNIWHVVVNLITLQANNRNIQHSLFFHRKIIRQNHNTASLINSRLYLYAALYFWNAVSIRKSPAQQETGRLHLP